MKERYILSLTKSEINKLYELSKNNKKQIPLSLRNQLFDLYVLANNIIVNGGGA